MLADVTRGALFTAAFLIIVMIVWTWIQRWRMHQ
jgi:hypothetical protein